MRRGPDDVRALDPDALVVMPVSVSEPRPESGYLRQGLPDMIRSQLGQTPGLKVLGRSATRDFKLIVPMILLVVLTLQLCTGMSNIVFDWPLVAAVAHNGGAALLLMLLLRLNYNIGLATRSAGAATQPSIAARAT